MNWFNQQDKAVKILVTLNILAISIFTMIFVCTTIAIIVEPFSKEMAITPPTSTPPPVITDTNVAPPFDEFTSKALTLNEDEWEVYAAKQKGKRVISWVGWVSNIEVIADEGEVNKYLVTVAKHVTLQYRFQIENFDQRISIQTTDDTVLLLEKNQPILFDGEIAGILYHKFNVNDEEDGLARDLDVFIKNGIIKLPGAND